MEHSVVLVMVFAVSMAINDQQEYKYDTLLSEVSALKRSVFNLNFELDKIREQHDDMRNELRIIRSNRNPSDTYTLNRLNENEKNREPKGDDEKTNILHKRFAYIPSFHLPRNISRVITGAKGEKGASGIKGPKGESGTAGPKGQKGSKGTTGPIGLKGDIGPVGPMGLKGQKGNPGSKGIAGIKGEIGEKGMTGNKGEPGQKETGTSTKKVAFTAQPFNDITQISEGRALIFSEVSLNLGDDYNPATGYFECSVAGVYVFTWSIEIHSGHSLSTVILVNGNIHGLQFASASTNARDSRYSSVILHLHVADTVYIAANSPTVGDTVIGFMSSSFSGYLLN